jgi:hypothetical protein
MLTLARHSPRVPAALSQEISAVRGRIDDGSDLADLREARSLHPTTTARRSERGRES